MYKGAGALVRRNYDALKSCGDDVSAMAGLLEDLIERFLLEHRKVEKHTAQTIAPVFRIHWDGDFYSVPYAEAWAKVIKGHPEIQFWVYTRSFIPECNVIPVLSGIDNLALYISVDEFNEKYAEAILSSYMDVRPAILTKTYAEGQEKVQQLIGRKAPKCPENAKKVPLVNDKGEGACVTCGLCVYDRGPVLFATSKK